MTLGTGTSGVGVTNQRRLAALGNGERPAETCLLEPTEGARLWKHPEWGLAVLVWELWPSERERIHFCCLSHYIFGYLLQQPHEMYIYLTCFGELL